MDYLFIELPENMLHRDLDRDIQFCPYGPALACASPPHIAVTAAILEALGKNPMMHSGVQALPVYDAYVFNPNVGQQRFIHFFLQGEGEEGLMYGFGLHVMSV